MQPFRATIDLTDEDDYQSIMITLENESVEIIYNAGILIDLTVNDWMPFIDDNHNMHELRLKDGYGSHCDNGYVGIRKMSRDKICFNLDTATGGEISMYCPVEQCRDAFNTIIEFYGTFKRRDDL